MNAKVTLLAVLIAAGSASSVVGQQDFKDFINGVHDNKDVPTTQNSWGVFLGMTQTESNVDDYLRTQILSGKWLNPFTGRPLWDAPVFVFGQDNPILEAARVITDHLDLHLLTDGDWRDLSHSHHNFHYIVCHSNGCTAAISAVESGYVSAKVILAMGTDWSTAIIDQGRMHGTRIIFFVNKTDPVPKIPGISVQQVTEHAPGFGYKLSFSDLGDVKRQLGNLVTENQPDTGSYLVVKMDPRTGLTGLKAHSLTDSHLPNVKEWFSRNGQSQQELRELLNLPSIQSPAPPPKPVSPPKRTARMPGSGTDRGGVSASVPIPDSDFAPTSKDTGKKERIR